MARGPKPKTTSIATGEAPVVKRPKASGRPGARGRTEEGDPNPIDRHVGNKMRQRRTLLGMSQEKLGEELGLTFQQVQKYERGANRISASRLFDLSRVLDVPVGWFFEDMTEEVAAASPAALAAGARAPADVSEGDTLAKRETLELVRAYYRITNQSARQCLLELTKAASAGQEDEDEDSN